MKIFTLSEANAQTFGGGSADPSAGGIFGPYNLGASVIGVMFLGIFNPETGAQPTVNGVRVTPFTPQIVIQNSFADGIFLAEAGSWFRTCTKSETWFFQTTNTGGTGLIFAFMLIEESDNFNGGTTIAAGALSGAGGSGIPGIAEPFSAAVAGVGQVVSNVPATLSGYFIENPDAVENFVQFFDNKTGSTTGTAKLSLGIPPGAAANLSGVNIPFQNGITVVCSSTFSGVTPPAANPTVNLW
jgi:hypothetical protein